MARLLIIVGLVIAIQATAQTSPEKQKIIYGSCTIETLKTEPFSTWYISNYDAYKPNPQVLEKLRTEKLQDITFQVFFGSWCGDSKREVPRFIKLMQETGYALKKISLIGVGGSDSLLKQSPQHEEVGKGIFRVPVFIVYKNGKEIGRITEFPVNSLEKDLVAILEGKQMESNYKSFALVTKWMEDGTLTDENISANSLAGQMRNTIHAEFELNSLGYLLLKQGYKKDALKIFQVNYYLFPESSNTISSLGEGYFENGDYKRAVSNLERSLEYVKKPAEIKPILEILYKVKAKESS